MKIEKEEMYSNEEHIIFYHEIGVAITHWAVVERDLYSVAAACFGETEKKKIARGFYAIESFRSKLQFVDEIIKYHFKDKKHDKIRDEWAQLHKSAQTYAKQRNKLAHRTVMVYMEGKPGRSMCLQKVINDDTKKKGGSTTSIPADALFTRDIIQIRYNFFSLSIRLGNFVALLYGQPAPFPKSVEQVMNPPTNRKLSNQIHELLGYKRGSHFESSGSLT